MSHAWDEINKVLEPGEIIEAIVFGPWGWSDEEEVENRELGYNEPDPPLIPFEMRGKLLSPSAAQKYMQDWSFGGGFGAPECYATYIWTNYHVFWVTQYDGATGLQWMPRHPTECMPDMPGG